MQRTHDLIYTLCWVVLGVVAGRLLLRAPARTGGFVAYRNSASLGEADRNYGQIRPAGTASMREPPKNWDEVDEMSDRSFPASDAPSTWRSYLTRFRPL